MNNSQRIEIARAMISGWKIRIPDRVLITSFWIIFIFLFVTGFLLRVYRIPEYLTFLSDQGRDAIILKRLVTLEKLVFVGPTTSIGSVFTGPFYYYLVAPFMLLWRLDPSGPAYGVAIINSIGLGVISFALYRLFGKAVSLLFLTVVTFSATQILQSRFSWNPNPVPIFSFLTLIALYLGIAKKSIKWHAAAGMLLGFSLQLHYLAVLLIPAMCTAYVVLHPKGQRGSKLNTLKNISTAACAVITTFTPLILFEIKNTFINFQALLRARSAGEVLAQNTTYIDRLNETLSNLFVHALDWRLDPYEVAIVIITMVITALFAAWKSRRLCERYFTLSCVVVIVAHIMVFSFLETGRHVHYYNVVFFPLYFLTSYVLVKTVQVLVTLPSLRRMLYVVLFAVLLQWSIAQLEKLPFLAEKTNRYSQIQKAQTVAKYVIRNLSSDTYQIVGLPYYETIGHYRYFLEYYGKRPMSAEALGDPDELFVACLPPANKEPDCGIAGNPQWQIADFQNRHQTWRVEQKEKVDDAIVYKLVKK
jgi:hypothetical protein